MVLVWPTLPPSTSNANIVPPGGIQQHDHAIQEPFGLCHALHLYCVSRTYRNTKDIFIHKLQHSIVY